MTTDIAAIEGKKALEVSDSQFIAFCKKLSNIEDLGKKLEYYFSIAGLPVSGGISRKIKGKDYRFFVERTAKEQYEVFWLCYYQKAIQLFVDFIV